MNNIDKLSDEEKELLKEAWEAGVNSVFDEIYAEGVFNLESEFNSINEDKIMRKRLPNKPSKINPNNPDSGNDLHQRAPSMRKKIGKLKL